MNFKSYAASQALNIEQIKKYAHQYQGVDMAMLIGMDEDNFPFLIWESENDFLVMFWNSWNGMMAMMDDDPVRNYAAAKWLKENDYPVFTSILEVEEYAVDHNWPRK